MAYLIMRTDIHKDAIETIRELWEIQKRYNLRHINWEEIKYYMYAAPLYVFVNKELAIKECRRANRKQRKEMTETGVRVITYYEEIDIYY